MPQSKLNDLNPLRSQTERERERETKRATYSQWAAYGFRFTISQTGPLCSDAACALLRLFFFGLENGILLFWGELELEKMVQVWLNIKGNRSEAIKYYKIITIWALSCTK